MPVLLRTIVMNLFTIVYAVIIVLTFIFVLPLVMIRDKIQVYFLQKRSRITIAHYK